MMFFFLLIQQASAKKVKRGYIDHLAYKRQFCFGTLMKLLQAPMLISTIEELVFVAGGILEVQPNHVTILADTAIRGHDLDEARALEAKERAEEDLRDKASDIDYARAQSELSVAVAQLAALAKLRKKK